MTNTANAFEIGTPRGYDTVLAALVAIVENLTEDWDTGLSGRIDAGTRLMADLGFASIDVVALIAAIDERWQRRDWSYERLLMTEGRYVEDLTVGEVAEFLFAQGAC